MIIKDRLPAAVDSFVQFLEEYCSENRLIVRIREVQKEIDGVQIRTLYLTPSDSVSSMQFNSKFNFIYEGVFTTTETILNNSINVAVVSFVEI